MELFQNGGKPISHTSGTVTLYHGSKSGICGAIAPISRAHCDFGKGFYMGTDRMQPLTLICNYPSAKIYTLSAELSNLKLLDVEVGLDWAMFVAYHRGKMESAKDTQIYRRIADLSKGCDMVIGYIANDRMFVVLDRFFRGEITDQALIHSLSALKLGKQYVARTEKACKNIKILEEHELSQEEREKFKQESEANRSQGIALADEICRKYRREGRFFDEILEEGEPYEFNA
ncbi:MAG: DUF3990 domain-containing protein [Eubacteriales bacterium]|nr:DUF3990 domain-containing protein [Eubacteriales bacterium]